jgi:hypothetical protein
VYAAISYGTDQCAPVAGTALAWFQECGLVPVLNPSATWLVPVTVNGVKLFLFAMSQTIPV